MNTSHDNVLYRKLDQPITREAAQAHMDRFFEGLRTLREECHIPNLLVVSGVTLLDDNGAEFDTLSVHHLGETSKAVGMAAYCYGKMQADQQAYIGRLLKSK